MNSAKSIETLYNIIQKLSGPIEAKKFLADSLYNIMSEIQEENLPVTASEIEKRLSKKAYEYLEVSKNNVA